MKATHILATLVVATLPLGAITAEDSSKTETADQKQEQNSDMTGMKGMMGKGQMMSNWKDQDAELDKLVAEMNSAPADKKLDAVAAVVTKLVEQRQSDARADAEDDVGEREGRNGYVPDDDGHGHVRRPRW